MIRAIFIITVLLLAMTLGAPAQTGNAVIIPFTGAPSGGCGPLILGLNMSNGSVSSCPNGSWTAIGGGGSGTVTSVTGTANQINVATGTTTPALSLSSTLIMPGTLTVTGATTGPSFTGNGSTSGFLDLPQGTTSSGTAPCNTANSICWQAPTSVTAQLRTLAGTPATGFSLWTNSAGSMTETLSGTQGTITAGPATFGTSAINTVIAGTLAAYAGHFTNIQVITSLGGTCTTPPQFNVFDGTSNTGTAVVASATTQTKGNATVQSQTLTFAAGDQIGIYISTAGGTCTTDSFAISAQYSTP